jgi:hypothetical protein
MYTKLEILHSRFLIGHAFNDNSVSHNDVKFQKQCKKGNLNLGSRRCLIKLAT